jgi:hypothetical protein
MIWLDVSTFDCDKHAAFPLFSQLTMCCSWVYKGKQAALAVKTIVYDKIYSAGHSDMNAYIDLYGAHLNASTYQVKAAQT